MLRRDAIVIPVTMALSRSLLLVPAPLAIALAQLVVRRIYALPVWQAMLVQMRPRDVTAIMVIMGPTRLLLHQRALPAIVPVLLAIKRTYVSRA